MSIGMEKKANAQYHSEVWGVKPVVIDGRGIFISCFVFNYFFLRMTMSSLKRQLM